MANARAESRGHQILIIPGHIIQWDEDKSEHGIDPKKDRYGKLRFFLEPCKKRMLFGAIGADSHVMSMSKGAFLSSIWIKHTTRIDILLMFSMLGVG